MPSSRGPVPSEDFPTGETATYVRPAGAPPRPGAGVVPQEPPTAGKPTVQVSRAELAEQFRREEPTTPRLPKAPPPGAEKPAPVPASTVSLHGHAHPKAPPEQFPDELTPLATPAMPLASPLAPKGFGPGPSYAHLPHLDHPPPLSSRAPLDTGLTPLPELPSVPLTANADTTNLRLGGPPPAETRVSRPQPPATPPRPAPARPPVVMDLPADADRTPVHLNRSFAVTQPSVAGPFVKRPGAAPSVAPAWASGPQSGELSPTTEAGLAPVTSTGLERSLGDALGSEPRSDVGPLPPLPSEVREAQVMAAPASLPRRCFAFLVDLSVVGALCLGVFYGAAALKGHAPAEGLGGLDALMFRAHALGKLLVPAVAACLAVALAYVTFFGSRLGGRSPGRLLTGVRLVDGSGRPPGLLRSALRAVFSLVSFGLCLAGFWLALFDRKGQTLHDKLTHTFVVRPL